MSSIAFPGSWTPRKRLTWRRFAVAIAIVILLHLVFIFFVAPYLEIDRAAQNRTEVVEISPQQLANLKRKIMKDKYLSPLMKQELHPEYKTQEAPKDAKMMAPFNQTVPKEKIAGAQPDVPLDGGGGGGKPKNLAPPKPKLTLSDLGLGKRLPPPMSRSTANSPPGVQGPPGPHRAVGREDKNLERADENLLNAAESQYYSFFARFEEPIIRNWFFNLRNSDSVIHNEMASRNVRAGAELPITIEFILDRQGNFRKIDIIESSGIPSLDRATQDAVKKLGAIPNPPADLFEGGQYFTKRLQFMVHVTDAPVINQRPDLAW